MISTAFVSPPSFALTRHPACSLYVPSIEDVIMAAVEASRPPEPDPFAVSDEEVDAVLEEAGGDSREATRAD